MMKSVLHRVPDIYYKFYRFVKSDLRCDNLACQDLMRFISSSPIEEEFEDTKGVIRIRRSTKDRQHNDQQKRDKRTNNDHKA